MDSETKGESVEYCMSQSTSHCSFMQAKIFSFQMWLSGVKESSDNCEGPLFEKSGEKKQSPGNPLTSRTAELRAKHDKSKGEAAASD